MIRLTATVMVALGMVFALSASGVGQTIIFDETAGDGDLGTGFAPNALTLNIPAANDTYRIVGYGQDSVDDGDSFNIALPAGADYTITVTDDGCCQAFPSNGNAAQGTGFSGEFKWIYEGPDETGASTFMAASTGFSSPLLDSDVVPVASFRTFFGPAGRAGPYWVDVEVSGLAAAVVPEPTSVALWSILGCIGLAFGIRRFAST